MMDGKEVQGGVMIKDPGMVLIPSDITIMDDDPLPYAQMHQSGNSQEVYGRAASLANRSLWKMLSLNANNTTTIPLGLHDMGIGYTALA